MRGVIFDIQHYAVYDGPGIRTAVYMKGCPLRCWWCHNPESQRREIEVMYREDRCAGCGVCVEACPQQALTMARGRVVCDPNRCTRCLTCVDACRTGAREAVGIAMRIDEVIARVLQDKPFYDASGGGVTITGGDPTAQPDFLRSLIEALHEEALHTALETCGQFAPALIEDLCAHTDLFLFDLKHMDAAQHRAGTGATNETILANFKALLARVGCARLLPRIPLIPGFNTGAETIEQLAVFLVDAGYTGPVDLMPGHGWARDKYLRLGRGHDFHPVRKPGERTIDRVTATFQHHGLQARVQA